MDSRVEIEGFELLEVIGRGGMGTVYRARQKSPSRFVALKVIHSHLAHDPQFRARFESEMRVAVELDHPNLVPLIDANESNGNLYMAFQLVRGRDLKEILKQGGPMSPDEAIRVITQISSALEYVHESGIVHRDVKPSNVIIDERNGHAYLADFGIAKSRDASQALTGSAAIGSLDYIAPEQFALGEVDGRVDVYAEGCVLFELLSGRTPFEEESMPSLMKAKVDSKARTLSEVGVPVSSGLEAVIATALERDPEQRFASPADLAEAANQSLKGSAPTRRMPISRDDPTERFGKTKVMGDRDADRAESPVPAKGWLKPAVIGAALVLLLAGLGLGVSNLDSDGGETPTAATRVEGETPAGADSETVRTTSSELSENEWSQVSTTLVDAKVPQGWEELRVDERNATRLTSEWVDPSNPKVTVLIDALYPPPTTTALANALDVRETKSQLDGYSEISFNEEDLGSLQATRWEFTVPAEGRKVDYFLQDCNVGVAVLGTAPPAVFDDYAADFREVAASVQPICQKLDTNAPISTEGIGPVLAGMTKSEAEDAGDIKLRSEGYVTGSCGYFTTDSLPDVGFMFNKGTLARIDVMNSEIATLSGIRVGDSEDAVLQAYGDDLKREANFYDPNNGSYLTYVPDDQADKHRVLFDVIEGEVVNIRAGRLPEINYVEGCA
jgi:serine/threonine protein kinase